MIYRLSINPIPCPRPRIAVRGKIGTAYYPKSYQDWKTECAKLLLVQPKPYFGAVGTDQPGFAAMPPSIRLSCHFECKQPGKTKLAAPKGDIDNYVKSLMDALTQADWWGDDSQVIHLVASKSWAPKGEPGLIRFTIAEETNP